MAILTDDPIVILRTLVVGVLAYGALIAILRVSGKRTLSQMNAFDLIVTVALGSTLATIIISKDVSLLQGVLALALLVGLQYAITWASVRSDRVSRIAKSEPTTLVYKGELLHDAMHRERVVEGELLAAVREHGRAEFSDVDLVVLETDGTISVVPELNGPVPDAAGLSPQRPKTTR